MALRSILPAIALACATVSGQTLATDAAPATITSFLAAELDDLEQLYQHFHRHPELSYRERRTSQKLAAQLEACGVEVTRGVGGFGVVGLLRNGDGPVVMLRADMDALPIAEQTELPYSSEVRGENDEGQAVGFMHACGHDLHMTNLVGTVRYLASRRSDWRGTLLLIGQPAEERGGGARAMLKDGLFERFPKPDYALALHVAHDLATGTIGWRAGPALANVDSVDITVFGRGGHGSTPQLTIDPITIAAYLVVELQSIVAREIAPTDPAVITVGAIHGGSKHNIIPDSCHLQLTVRSYDDGVRQHLLDAIRRKADATAAAHRAPSPEVEFSEGTPALLNDAALVARVVPVLKRALGDDQVREMPPSMGGEDFSRYGRAGVPIFMFRLGTVAPQRLAGYRERGEQPPGLHSSTYYPDARASLTAGIHGMSAAVLELLPR